MQAIQGREKTVDVVRWAIVLLGALAAWECARTVNMAAQTKGLVHPQEFAARFDTLTAAEGEEPFADRLGGYLVYHADVLITGLFLLGVTALVARMLFASSLLDYLYLESEARDRRTMVGFLLSSGGLLVLVGLIYAMVVFARADGENGIPWSGYVPIAMAVYLLFGALWMVLMRLGAKKEDKGGLRGFWPALVANVLVGGGLGYLVWHFGGDGPEAASEFHTANPLRNIAITAFAALLVCSLDAVAQGRVYGKKRGRSKLCTAVTVIVLLAVLAFAGYMAKIVWAT